MSNLVKAVWHMRRWYRECNEKIQQANSEKLAAIDSQQKWHRYRIRVRNSVAVTALPSPTLSS